MCNDEAGAFRKPCIPYEPVGTAHIAGPAKHTAYSTRRIAGGTFLTYTQRGAVPDWPVVAASPTHAPLRAA